MRAVAVFEKMASKYVDTGQVAQLSRFVVVGLLNTLIGYLSFLIYLVFFSYPLALLLSHITGVINSYIWNRYWTFKSANSKLKEFIKFNLVYLIVFVANLTLLSVFVDNLKIDPKIGQLFLLPVITAISYFGHKYWSFKKE